MKRRVVTTSVATLDGEQAWLAYRRNVITAFGPRDGLRIVTAIEAGERSEIKSRDYELGVSVVTSHEVTIIDEPTS